jgi:hypothetical protein
MGGFFVPQSTGAAFNLKSIIRLCKIVFEGLPLGTEAFGPMERQPASGNGGGLFIPKTVGKAYTNKNTQALDNEYLSSFGTFEL